MCDVFPEVKHCCICCTLRVGMVFIAVFSVMSGGCILSVVEGDSDACYNFTDFMLGKGRYILRENDAWHFYDNMRDFVTLGLTIHGWLFIFAGLILLLNVFSAEDGWAQAFTWLMLFNIIIGTITTVVLCLDCTIKGPRCFMAMDWLEAAFFTSISFFYYGAWFYFIMVTSSFVLNGDTPIAEY